MVSQVLKIGRQCLASAIAALVLTGCGDIDSGSATATTNLSPSSSNAPSSDKSAADAAPSISGAPGSTVNAGTLYSFQPSASDANGDKMTFSIQNKPSWASFDVASGQLSGTPQAGDVNTYSDIVISVSDGKTTVTLATFAISVTSGGNGRAMLSWAPPTQNTDGTALQDLAGYQLLYGTNPQNLTASVKVSNASVSTYVVENLSAGTWYFAIKAFTHNGAQSDASSIGSKTVI